MNHCEQVHLLFLAVSNNMHYNFVKKKSNKFKYYSKHSCNMLSLVFNKPFLRKSSLSKLQDYIKSLSFYIHLHSVNYLNKKRMVHQNKYSYYKIFNHILFIIFGENIELNNLFQLLNPCNGRVLYFVFVECFY